MVPHFARSLDLRRRLASAVVLVSAWFIPAALRAADHVAFDVPTTTAVRDVTTPEFAAEHPNERLIEVRLLISALIRNAPADLQFLYGIDFPLRGIEIVDYLPKTTMTSDVVGNIGIETQSEDLETLGIVITGAQPPLTGTLNGTATDKESLKVHYELLPPLETVAASGTLNRRTSAYFRMRPTARLSLEGDKEFVLVLRVPAAWRGGYLALHCKAVGVQKSATPPFKETLTLGHAHFVVGLYLSGDEHARLAAHHFAIAELRLRESAARHQRELERQTYPTVIHKVGALLSLSDPKLPNNWLETLINAPAVRSHEKLARQLPEAVSIAAQKYLEAREQLATLSH